MLTFVPRGFLVLCLVSGAAPALRAQGRPSAALSAGEAPAPLAPEVVSRDTAGHVTVRAVRVASGLRIDGRLDESAYESPSVSDFLQQEPNEGRPATEKTEAWVFFDDNNIYVSARCWDTQPGRRVANCEQ